MRLLCVLRSITAMNAARPCARRTARVPLLHFCTPSPSPSSRWRGAAQLACLTGALLLLCVLRSIAFGAVAVASDILEVVATANFSALTPVVTGDGASARASLS